MGEPPGRGGGLWSGSGSGWSAGCGICEQSGPPRPVSPAVRALFELLRARWHELEVLSARFADELRPRLDALQAEDFCIGRAEALRLQDTGSAVGYEEVYSGPEVTLCIFVLAAGARIPLHDHPEMHVLGRLLFGRMRVTSYDPEPGPERPGDGGNGCTSGPRGATQRLRPQPGGPRWATHRCVAELGPEPTTYSLGPKDGNMHELHALEDCAFFDIVLPPYDPTGGRSCTYYTASGPLPATVEAGPERYWLIPSSAGDFTTEPLEYLGPVFDPP